MSHYFSKQPTVKSNPQTIEYHFHDVLYRFITDTGVFSKAHIDFATDLLLKNLTINAQEEVLDLGCGYGIIGIILADYFKAKATLIDVNERALELANHNAQNYALALDIHYSDGFLNIDKDFDHIITNPPIRIGKEKLYNLFADAKSHLKPQGKLWLVMHKKHGVLSAIKFLENHYTVSTITKQKGFHVIACQN